ncbi:hypothetical protein AB0E16_28660, partial [Streptomyces sp. NPDC047970]
MSTRETTAPHAPDRAPGRADGAPTAARPPRAAPASPHGRTGAGGFAPGLRAAARAHPRIPAAAARPVRRGVR